MNQKHVVRAALIFVVTGCFIAGSTLLTPTALQLWSGMNSLLFGFLAGVTGLTVGLWASCALFPSCSLHQELELAIRNDEFTPNFQPIIDLQSRQISGFEMLARWTRSNGERVPPDQFIPLVEQSGRIDAMLFSLLRTAGHALASQLRNNPDLKLTFNVTPAQFLDPTFLPRLIAVVSLVGIPLKSLEAEITEQQRLEDMALASQRITQYKKHGIRVAIDDVGTGYNGLSFIQKLEVSTMKLDRVFIKDIVKNKRSRQMVEMLADLARQYGMSVVAEGIETDEQAEAISSMGIKEGQGFYFSRPIPADDLLDMLRQQIQPKKQNSFLRPAPKQAVKLRIAS